jgi:hypothetical protein
MVLALHTMRRVPAVRARVLLTWAIVAVPRMVPVWAASPVVFPRDIVPRMA